MSFFRLDIREQIRILWNRLGAIGNRVTTLEGSSGGVTDHGALTGLSDDDHTQYVLLAGRATGQSIIGGTGAGENITIFTTSHGTKGKFLIGTSGYSEVDNYFGINTNAPTSRLHIVTSSLGVVQTEASGILLLNTTAAAAGAQQMSPGIIQGGSGWKTDATAGSQAVRFMQDVLPVQGAANPTGTWQLKYSIDGAAYAIAMSVNNTGNFTLRGNGGATKPWINFDNSGGESPELRRGGLAFLRTNVGGGGGTVIGTLGTFTLYADSVGVSVGSIVAPVAAVFYTVGTTQTGSNANGIINSIQTWNTSGTPTAWKLNITDTASNAASKLIDLQVGAATKFNVDKAGNLVHTGISRTAGYTVGTLPATPVQGDRAFVTDALTPTWGALAVGGGAVVVPVMFDGTIWITA